MRISDWSSDVCSSDLAGLSALLAATRDSWQGRPDAVSMLLANGADPSVVVGAGNTPLHHAARSSDPGVVAALLDAGATLDEIGSASCRERVCRSVWLFAVAVHLKNTNKHYL